MVLATFLLCFAAFILAIPVLVLFLQVTASLPQRRPAGLPSGPRPNAAILIPAHNEAQTIRRTLMSVSSQMTESDRLVVIADNCSDDTAELARQHGAEVAVRTNDDLRGKGYALDHGLGYLEKTGAPEVVIFVDADCQLHQECLARLALASHQSGRPVQAAYLMNPPNSSRMTASLVCFAWKVRDFVRPLGWHRLALPCQLAGSGMAFPWNVARSTDLASGHLTEDLKQSLDLALTGKFALFCPDAVVTSDVAPAGTPSASQRARWEHGTLEIAIEYIPRLAASLFKSPSLSLIAVMLDLMVPPLALLALSLAVVLTLSLLMLFWGTAFPAKLSGIICLLFFSAICMAWWRHGQDLIRFRLLMLAPVYAVLKIPLYGRFFFTRQRSWVRGER
jgi:cellulose synthase/poly-beta-1,6-N-acetylglucosamine synthase-like glycosyltransferase